MSAQVMFGQDTQKSDTVANDNHRKDKMMCTVQ